MKKEFSSLKIMPIKNTTRSHQNIITSSERKRKSQEKSEDFLSSTIKKTNEELYIGLSDITLK